MQVINHLLLNNSLAIVPTHMPVQALAPNSHAGPVTWIAALTDAIGPTECGLLQSIIPGERRRSMGLVEWIRTERTWAKVFGRAAYLSRRRVSGNLFRINGVHGEFFFRPSESDPHTIWQVFKNREYDLSPYPQGEIVRRLYESALATGMTPVIIDAGANIGAASVWFATRYPQARIVAVEPDPENASICRMNAAPHANIEVVEAAIGAIPGNVSIQHINGAWGTRTHRGGDIPVVTVGELLGRFESPHLLIAKIDIEGFEKDLFSEGLEWLDSATALFVEPHDWMLPGEGTSRSFRSSIGPEFDMLIAGENLLFVRAGATMLDTTLPPAIVR